MAQEKTNVWNNKTVLQIILESPIWNVYSLKIKISLTSQSLCYLCMRKRSWIKAVVRCVNFNPSPSQVRCSGSSVIIKDLATNVLRNRFLLTSGGPRPPRGPRGAVLRPWRWRQLTARPSTAFLRRHLKHEEAWVIVLFQWAGMLLDYRPDWAPERFHPLVTNNMFTPAPAVFKFLFL